MLKHLIFFEDNCHSTHSMNHVLNRNSVLLSVLVKLKKNLHVNWRLFCSTLPIRCFLSQITSRSTSYFAPSASWLFAINDGVGTAKVQFDPHYHQTSFNVLCVLIKSNKKHLSHCRKFHFWNSRKNTCSKLPKLKFF